MRWIGSHGDHLKLKAVCFLLGSTYIHQGFIYVLQGLFWLQLFYRYIAVAHKLQWTSESLAGLVKRDSWTPLTVSGSVWTAESAFLTIFKMMLDAGWDQGLDLRTTVYTILKNSFCVFLF